MNENHIYDNSVFYLEFLFYFFEEEHIKDIEKNFSSYLEKSFSSSSSSENSEFKNDDNASN